MGASRDGEVKTSDWHLKFAGWSQEDECYVGTCPGLMLSGSQGDDDARVDRELCQAVEEWIKIYRKDGTSLPAATARKNYSGKFVVRVGPELHQVLAADVFCRGESLNSYCMQFCAESARNGAVAPKAPAGRRK